MNIKKIVLFSVLLFGNKIVAGEPRAVIMPPNPFSTKISMKIIQNGEWVNVEASINPNNKTAIITGFSVNPKESGLVFYSQGLLPGQLLKCFSLDDSRAYHFGAVGGDQLAVRLSLCCTLACCTRFQLANSKL